MFGSQKKTDEPDSDSDWDSLSGDANLPTPRNTQPTPPSSNSPRFVTSDSKNTSTPIKNTVKSTSKPTTPVVTESRKNSASSVNQKPSQMYGKSSGVTAFVDRSEHSITTVSDTGVDKRKNVEPIPVDTNSNKMNVSTRKKDKERTVNAVELNELDLQEGKANLGFYPAEDNPPYMDFEDALPSHEVKQAARSEQKRGKIKTAYLRNQTPDHIEVPNTGGNHSWDESEHEEDPAMFLATTPTTNHHLNKHQNHTKPLADQQEHVVEVHIPEDEACCVPYQKKKGNGYTYIFNHGKFQYFDVVADWREPFMKTIGERSERWLTYFWQEFFGALGLIIDFGLIFLLELIKFTFRKVLVRLLVGFIIVFGDHLLKPVLAALFNSFLQPSFTFSWNVFLGLKNAIKPLLDITREIVLQFTTLIKGFRLFELIWKPFYGSHGNSARAASRRVSQQQIQEI